MRATLMYGAGDVRVETVPDPSLREPTDALVRVHAGVHLRQRSVAVRLDAAHPEGRPDRPRVHRRRRGPRPRRERVHAGDLVVAPFVWADNTCDFCPEGLQTSCRHGGGWGAPGVDGGQGEAVRVPQAQGTLVKLPVG